MDSFRRIRERDLTELDPLTQYDSEEFSQSYRLSKEGVQYVYSLIEAGQRRGDFNVSAQQKLLIKLRYLETGNYQRVD